MTITPPIVYIDAVVFAYRLLLTGGQRGFSKGTSFFLDLQNRRYVGVTSSFTVMEYRGLAKRAISRASGLAVTPAEESTAMQDLENFLTRMAIRNDDSDLLATNQTLLPSRSDIYASAEPIIINSGTYLHQVKNEWRSIGGADSLVTIFAERLGASFIATFDLGFKNLAHPTIKPIMIQEVY